MSTQVNGEVPRKETVMVGINSHAEAGKLARKLVDAVESLRSEHGYQCLAELVDRIPKLEADIREKEKALKKAGEELEDEKRTHAVERQTSLRLYTEESAHFKVEKVGLEKQITDLRSTISKKDEMITDLRKREDGLKVAGRKLEETCKGKISQLNGKEKELKEITEQLEKSQKENKTLSATKEAIERQGTALKKSLDEAQQRNIQLDKDVKIVRGNLEELRSFSVELEDTDLNKVYANHDPGEG
jgi:chromosome segregation ATPase